MNMNHLSDTTKTAPIDMTLGQAMGMLRFAKVAYKAYKHAGQVENAKQARRHMIAMYLKVRALR